MQAFSTAGQEMYQAQASEAGDEETNPEEGSTGETQADTDEDVVEADYEIVEEEN
jgi:hypothetical protein